MCVCLQRESGREREREKERDRDTERHTQRERVVLRNWLTCLWMLASSKSAKWSRRLMTQGTADVTVQGLTKILGPMAQ